MNNGDEKKASNFWWIIFPGILAAVAAIIAAVAELITVLYTTGFFPSKEPSDLVHSVETSQSSEEAEKTPSLSVPQDSPIVIQQSNVDGFVKRISPVIY